MITEQQTLRPRRASPAAQRARPGVRLARGWFLASCLAVAVLAPLPYLTNSLDELAAGNAGLAAHYATQPIGVRLALMLHIVAGGLALLLVPLQFVTARRWRRPVVHRVLGVLLVAAVLVAAAAGLVIAQVSYAGTVGTLGFSALALCWGASAVAAASTAARGRRAAHRRWTIRLAALSYAAVTLRLWLVVLISVQIAAGQDGQVAFDRAYALVPFLSWVPNLVVAELLVRRGQRGRPGRRTGPGSVEPDPVTAAQVVR